MPRQTNQIPMNLLPPGFKFTLIKGELTFPLKHTPVRTCSKEEFRALVDKAQQKGFTVQHSEL